MTIIEYREPVLEDGFDLLELQNRYQHTFLGDYEEVKPESFTLEEMLRKFTLVFTTPAMGNQAIGSVDFNNFNHDLSAELHFSIRPAFLKTFLQSKIYLDALLDRFRVMKIRKFVIEVPDFNNLQKKLAERIGFKRTTTLHDECYYQGKVYDVHYYTLTRKDLAKALAAHFIEQETEPAPKPIKKTRKPRKLKVDHVQQQERQNSISATA